jgi:hypothetical protein
VTATTVGTLGSSRRAVVDGSGRVVAPEGARWELDWWIGAEDRRHLPEREASLRQRRPGVAPAVETAVRVPSGDALHRVYAAGGSADLVIVEIENDSPIPFAAGLVVRGHEGRTPATAVDGRRLVVDGEPAVILPRPPLRRETDDGDAVVYPVAHRTTLRFAVALGSLSDADADEAPLPDLDEVSRGWSAQLDRGMRVDIPDEGFLHAVDCARADLLLARTDAAVVAALEDWGFDAEFRQAWPRLRFRARRRARRRTTAPGTWSEVQAARDEGSDAARFLLALRRLLVQETGDGVDLLTDLPAEWVGSGIEVHDAPTRRGLVSYAVRWHGDRPALLWKCEHAFRLRAPGLDPSWATDRAEGEALLSPHHIGISRSSG